MNTIKISLSSFNKFFSHLDFGVASFGNSFWLILFLAVFIRFLISLTTFHPDITALNFAGFIIQNGNIFSFYDYIFNLPEGDAFTKAFASSVFTYPPLIYLTHGLFNTIWVNVFQISFMNDYIIIHPETFNDPLLKIVMFLNKLPYFFFDIPIAFLLTKFVDTQKEKILVFFLWLFNPIDLFATYMMGQHDIIAVFFIVLALVLAKYQRLNWAALSLGLGIAYKLFPIFLVVPLVLTGKSWSERIKLFILCLLPYIISILPYLSSKGYRTTSLLANQSLKSLYAQIPISGGESILLFPAALIFLYLVFFYMRNTVEHLWQNFFIVLLVFFIFTHTHPQWFLWLTPFLIIDLVRTKFQHLILLLGSLVSFIALLLFFDQSLSIGLFSPLVPDLATLPSIWVMLNIPIDYNFYRSMFQTLFVGVAMYYIFYYFPKKTLE